MSGPIGDNVARASGVVAAAGGGGKVLQVVTSFTPDCNGDTQSGTYVAFGGADATLDITPTADTSKILLMAPMTGYAGHDVTETTFYRDSTNVNGNGNTGIGIWTGPPGGNNSYGAGFTWLDDPATTSTITYSMKHRSNPGGTSAHAYSNYNFMTTMTAMEIDFS